jgi:hypothetical protein
MPALPLRLQAADPVQHLLPGAGGDNAEVVTDPIARVTTRAVVTTADGTRHEVDTIITAIGYRYSRSLLVDRISGHGRPRRSATSGTARRARTSARAVPGFPNMFILLGPNAIGINSVIYLAGGADQLRDGRARGRWSARARLEVRPDALEDYVAEVDVRSEGSGLDRWRLQSLLPRRSNGRNFAIYPGFASEFRRRTRRFDAGAYDLAS